MGGSGSSGLNNDINGHTFLLEEHHLSFLHTQNHCFLQWDIVCSSIIIEFCANLGIQTKFIFVEHSQTNKQEKVANKVILLVMKKKLEEDKGLGDEQLYEVLWSYHTTPYSST